MATDPKQPFPGERHIDASELDFLIDLPEGGTLRLRRAQEGVEEVVQEIEANHSSLGSAIGLSEAALQKLKEIERKLTATARFKPAVTKLLELIEETEALLEDEREKLISSTARWVDANAKHLGDNELLAKYQKTRNYRSSRAKKAATTRRKNTSLKAV